MITSSHKDLDRIRIVLCRPEGSLNIGSVCRSMANMGISKLSIVGNVSQINQDEIKKMAIHAYPIFEEAQFFEELDQALAGTVLAAGITRRQGKHRKKLSFLPEELVQRSRSIRHGEIALVFGNERDGLNDNELACCSEACHIPSYPENPSLNLSHAVQILCYTFYTQRKNKASKGYEPVTLQQIEDLSTTVENTLEQAGYYDKPDRFNTKLFFKDIFARACLNEIELVHMEKVFQKLRVIHKDKG